MRARIWLWAVAATVWACGGQTFQTGGSSDAGADRGSGSGSGSSGGSGSGSSSSGSSSGGGSSSSGSGGSSSSGGGSGFWQRRKLEREQFRRSLAVSGERPGRRRGVLARRAAVRVRRQPEPRVQRHRELHLDRLERPHARHRLPRGHVPRDLRRRPAGKGVLPAGPRLLVRRGAVQLHELDSRREPHARLGMQYARERMPRAPRTARLGVLARRSHVRLRRLHRRHRRGVPGRLLAGAADRLSGDAVRRSGARPQRSGGP